jgi:hypothetical protein
VKQIPAILVLAIVDAMFFCGNVYHRVRRHVEHENADYIANWLERQW